jgi:hypothetical protein
VTAKCHELKAFHPKKEELKFHKQTIASVASHHGGGNVGNDFTNEVNTTLPSRPQSDPPITCSWIHATVKKYGTTKN